MKLELKCWRKPIPTNKFDWACYDSDTYDADYDYEAGRYVSDCPVGYGATEFEAIAAFVRELLLRNDDAQEMLVNCVPGARLEAESLIHSHTCQQCGHIICFDCDCDEPVRNLWCSARCKAAFDL